MRKPNLLIIITLILNACSSPTVPTPRDDDSSAYVSPTADESDSISEQQEGEIDISSMDWGDRSIFKANLIASQHEVLEQLPGAPVYRIDMEIADDLVNISAHQEVRFTNQEEIANI